MLEPYRTVRCLDEKSEGLRNKLIKGKLYKGKLNNYYGDTFRWKIEGYPSSDFYLYRFEYFNNLNSNFSALVSYIMLRKFVINLCLNIEIFIWVCFHKRLQ